MSCGDIWRKSILDRGNSKCKGHEVGVCLRNIKDASTAKANMSGRWGRKRS